MTVFVIVLVFAAAAAMVFLRLPEDVREVSPDQMLFVEGVSRGIGDLDILPVVTEGDLSVFRQYELVVSDRAFVQDAELRFDASDFEDVSDARFYFFDRSQLSWRSLPTVFDLTAKQLFTELDLSGSQLVGVGYLEGVE